MSSARCPTLLIAAPASGQGKTTVTAALARWHSRQGRKVRVFKCGPDFLDPHWHELASAAPVHSLDGWMTGPEDMAARLHAAAQEADVILIEGVMGLFDGSPSAAELAQRFNIPVLAVVDAGAMSTTFGAVVYGLVHYQPGLRWAGVLANRVATEHHAQLLQAGLRDPALWQGALPKVIPVGDTSLLPERHLGLVAAHELGDALQRLDAVADALEQTPLGQRSWQQWQDWAVDFAAPAAKPAAEAIHPWLQGRTVAVARDAAFSFIYPANLDCLQAMGAKLVFFSPLAGEGLPPCEAVWLPGGYPELHAPALMANQAVQNGLRAHWAAGKPIWAECGGMVALCEGITGHDGQFAPLWGLLPGRAVLQKRLAGLGMQQLATDTGLLRGHTFHYSRLESPVPVLARSSRPGQAPEADKGEALYQHGSLHASYFHAWFASSPRTIARWLGAEVSA
ncbi:MAG: cobyrinate a,c-diamide synthase [Giesbergeria sp.]|uniref:cobyrinate a,c-diamide synthase n=1 Tax=Giesbergeria sp. TaxID=2818473 RepID=UPI002603E936|nr:cobyrinate a,c-diamide synthase [Giesbergeria sp.]MDD2609566.1 cobyrinate a,c-diamide synthase [Giesbergeria sp.]